MSSKKRKPGREIYFTFHGFYIRDVLLTQGLFRNATAIILWEDMQAVSMH